MNTFFITGAVSRKKKAKMKILSIGILRLPSDNDAVILTNAHDVNSFSYFQRSG